MLRPWFSVDATQIHRININKASVERMMHHPYINFYQAKVIAEYRKKKGKLRESNWHFTRNSLRLISNESCLIFVMNSYLRLSQFNKKKMHSYHTRQECITHKQNKHSTDIFTDLRREATINI